MSTYTPEGARELAFRLDKVSTSTLLDASVRALRSLADQVEALTAERELDLSPTDFDKSKIETWSTNIGGLAQPAEVQPTPRRAYGEDYLEGVNVDRLERALTQLGVATCGREEMAARMAGYVNEITAAVMRHCEFLQSKPVEVQRVPLTAAQYNQIPELCAILPSLYERIVRAVERAHGIKPASEGGA